MNTIIILGLNTRLFQNHGQIFKPDASRCVKFKHLFDEFRIFAMDDNFLDVGIVDVAKRSTARKVSLPCFLPQSPCGVRT
ncbi:MAG: hypothetical protein A3E32_03025 [Candidatus Zambryskibacteria bacterium RIFCSPHIGHO2_12_FULL_38_37]|uniref:Uncharacterized protein n=1 Tax=Candidatus Zambryskibacteria bacterium RIFCSPHIGHO2_12_FULL_38_37 TaxID=1802751 RepID=A0A1G2TKJ4_9BACT|nr:MAG: hypothetical protein A3I28_00750 [Candidatus Giovannonibacteria bacterium RIFCSPLOWO2_02_FULL_43_37]OHA97359.1 MAG: hypothetical protein A3C63_01055 [Candidatus Zambryskibacteria bacterium RIFCSPHIGHO2_02_FULL_39_82]OHA97608.1 MAG: hypothetical protein A3E32_03025 [Candidatus Zambryskibacteria bacterium RIFCSPHIGHO2_12_FULL_38_37]